MTTAEGWTGNDPPAGRDAGAGDDAHERHDGHDGHGHHRVPASAVERRVAAMEALLVEKGLLTTDAIDAVIELYEHDVGPMNGAKVVARAWVDAGYRERLLADGTAAIAELGFGGAEGEHLVVLENTPAVHNVVVCTLCSCYPWPVLGLPPRWYKSFAYRSRVVHEPRAVLAEFGTVRPRGGRGAGVGLERRAALPGAAGAPGRHRRLVRGSSWSCARDPRPLIGVVR